ncbi:cytochrome c biogenesis CcdA family protein [Oceanibium sediminis]|uniref:cytochrome c biogenesis CcdA family protein n=1 Tax=Oceanibium sediminis TaxID=2026339 RepID=UPI000DD48C46|nr:cytochrome c biogenesis protein CcdA [Oceanibium sediminis]
MFDVSSGGAVIAGLMSFLSPCILPIVPFYLGYLAGLGAHEVASGAALPARARVRAVLGAGCFALGVITVFVGLGATATVLGAFVGAYFDTLRWLAAALIVAMGLHFLGVIRIGFLYRQFRSDGGGASNAGLLGAYGIGLAFAFGWTPCVGPVLSAILFIAAAQETAGQGAALLFAYGLGMTLPFIAAALFIGPFMAWMARFRRHLPLVERLTGVLLILFGVLIATNSINLIAQWMLDHVPWFATIG